MSKRSRPLVLTNEAAGHPFRRTLPAPESARAARRRRGDDDVKLFLLAFVAFFLSFSALIW